MRTGRLGQSWALAEKEMTSRTNAGKILRMDECYIHVQSMRLATGEEALVAVVLTHAGTVGYGFNLGLDATAARHMAMQAAGLEVKPLATEPGAGYSPRG
jgi:hypothetical protein